MANKKISAASNRVPLQSTDMIPVAALGSTGAFHVTGETLFNSIPEATSDTVGVVELATQAESAAATVDDRAVTPASLANAIGPAHMAEGWCFAGQLDDDPDVLNLLAIFEDAFGRAAVNGDMMIVEDPAESLYVVFMSEAAGGWFGFNATTGAFVSYY